MAKKKKEETVEKQEIEYGVNWLAEQSGLDTRTVRIKLRQLKVEKDGRSYDFGTKKEAEKVLKQVMAKTKAEASNDKEEAAPQKAKKKAKKKAA